MTATEPLDVGAIREAAEKATPGPWEWDAAGFMGCGQVFTMGEGVEGGSIAGPSGDCYPRSGYRPQGDMKFIATMDPLTTLALLDVLAELTEQRDAALGIHRSVTDLAESDQTFCGGCFEASGETLSTPWPCDTAKALGMTA